MVEHLPLNPDEILFLVDVAHARVRIAVSEPVFVNSGLIVRCGSSVDFAHGKDII